MQKQSRPQNLNVKSVVVPSSPSQETPGRDVMNLENGRSTTVITRNGTVGLELMVRGKPGSGKSTATKRAHELAGDSVSTDEAVVAFFFISRGASMETKLEGIFRPTLHQLLRSHGSINDDAFKEWQQRQKSTRSGWAWTARELQIMFKRHVVRSTINITMFMDALDLGSCKERRAAIKIVRHHSWHTTTSALALIV
ncbi:hypothetical protein BU25DRAFT_464735 [Macroventuria anomochaeta]|uniref:Uncharacterized protein n=1 Tax=Macroventuria anomochaeta TaxID=301207 RepID=A0ACB6SHZ6_9PLEO|nr:uncharacterized protein BU25DRAFT_464735 [Macroventuria anomochaeta]KAF2633598.1 hypothetical protein BU25DRAFT_464735 [Macroventuria anomochaeta]